MSDQVEIHAIPDGFPPLMVFSPRRLSCDAAEAIKAGVAEALRDRKPLLFDGDFIVAQFVDGRWEPIAGFAREVVEVDDPAGGDGDAEGDNGAPAEWTPQTRSLIEAACRRLERHGHGVQAKELADHFGVSGF